MVEEDGLLRSESAEDEGDASSSSLRGGSIAEGWEGGEGGWHTMQRIYVQKGGVGVGVGQALYRKRKTQTHKKGGATTKRGTQCSVCGGGGRERDRGAEGE